MAIKEAFNNYPSLTETVDGRLVGRVILSVGEITTQKTPEAQAIEQRLSSDPSFQRSIAHKLNWNTASLEGDIGVERGAFSYFSWNPADRTVIVEWGEIDAKNKARLHDYLNKMIDYRERDKQGMVVRSGHMSRFVPSGTVICLLDTTYQAKPIVDILNAHGFVVIDSMGCVQNQPLNEGADMRRVG